MTKKTKEKLIEASKLFTKLRRVCSFKECLYPVKSECSKKVSQAHSIQKKKILSKIAHNGEVISFDVLNSLFTGNFEKVGIKKASTFFGFCNAHDSKIFSDIENKDYLNTFKQNFLYAYRACAREYVVKREATCMLQKQMLNNPEIMKALSLQYTMSMEGVKDMVVILEKMQEELLKPKPNYNIIFTKTYSLSYESLIAVNSIFSILYDFKGHQINDLRNISKNIAPAFLNIFPQNGKTIILFSCMDDDLNNYKSIFENVDSFNQLNLELFFSNLIISHCENFFLSPEKWDKVSIENRRKTVTTFKDTMYDILEPNYLLETSPINLFDVNKV